MDKLIPCFCGNRPTIVNDIFTDKNGIMRDSWHVECGKCGTLDLSRYSSESAAVNAWNEVINLYNRRADDGHKGTD